MYFPRGFLPIQESMDISQILIQIIFAIWKYTGIQAYFQIPSQFYLLFYVIGPPLFWTGFGKTPRVTHSKVSQEK